MAATEMEMATLSVSEVAAMDDSELHLFMGEHRRPNGDYELPVDGWDRLSTEERSRLAERLK